MIDRVMLPCEHGGYEHHGVATPSGKVNLLPDCPGGRVVEIDYEAALEALTDWAFELAGITTAEEALNHILAAALGVNEWVSDA